MITSAKNQVRTFFEAYSSIFFVRDSKIGAAIFALSFWVPNIGVHGLLGGLIGICFSYALARFSQRIVSPVLMINCILIGLFEGVLFKISFNSFITLVVLCLNTSFIFLYLESVFGPSQLPVLSFPFSISSSILLSSLFQMGHLEWTYPYHWESQNSLETGFLPLDLGLKSIGSILFTPNATVGLAILIMIFIYSRIQFLVIAFTLLLSFGLDRYFFVRSHFGSYSWANFNVILFGLAIGTFFLTPGLWTLCFLSCSIVFFFFGFQLFLSLWSTRPEWIHSLPYAIFCLFALQIIRRFFPQSLNPYLGLPPERVLDLATTKKDRFGQSAIILKVPVETRLTVHQGFFGKWTHQGRWSYALDFVIQGDDLKTYKNLGAEVVDFHIFEKRVVCPCSGWVEMVESQNEDRKIGFVGHEKNWGNFVLIRLGVEGPFVLLAHLKKDSIKVKVGDYVYVGQDIAAVGNSGYSPEPHLHMHVQKTADLGAETVPFSLEPYICNEKVSFYSIPKQMDQIESFPVNRILQFALNFNQNESFSFEYSNQGQAPRKVLLKVSMNNESGRWQITDPSGGVLSFWKDGTHFYFYDLICESESPLMLLAAAIPIVPFTFGRNLHWTDTLPNLIQYKGLTLLFQELRKFFGIRTELVENKYSMSTNGMEVRGDVVYQNQRTLTCLKVDPVKGIQTIEVGKSTLKRIA